MTPSSPLNIAPDDELPGAGDDVVLPFAVEGLEVRGRVVRLAGVVDDILSRHDYPEPVARLVGEAIALTILLGTSLKFEGRFILQTQSDGPVSMMVVDFSTPATVRACAKFDAAAVAATGVSGNLAALFGKGHLAMTIDQGADMSRYQGVVPLEGQSLSDAADLYFRQSEQIPTLVRLAVAESISPGEGGAQWRAGGIIVQYLPEDGGTQMHRDLPPGDAPEGSDAPGDEDPDAWTEARLITETVEDDELIDPTISPERLLYRLFHERGVRVFDAQPVKHECRCSRPRIENMLQQFTPEERADMLHDDGEIYVVCEFCSAEYHFDPKQFDEKSA